MVDKTFVSGDKVLITSPKLLYRGKRGVVEKWCHDNVYIIRMENGKGIVVLSDEIVREME